MKLKKALSIILSLSIVASIISLNSNAFAGLIDSILNIDNPFVNTLAECDHDYVFYKTTGSPTCTKKASVTYRCAKCGTTTKSYTALGHLYKVTGIYYHEIEYKCDYCDSTTIKSTDYAKTNYQAYHNRIVRRGNDNYYVDVVSDGIINAKDYALIKQVAKPRLTNDNADKTTKQIYQYLYDINGKKTLSAQQESTWMGSVDYEIDYVYSKTNKYPAMRGLDYMNDDFNGVNKRAISWWNKGGLVTICWHTGSDFSGEWNDAMNDTVSSWSNMLTEGTTEYNNMIAGMDKAASALKELQDNGVTVLWRPFHEFDGQWFWWGKGGSENFKKLWRIMYDRYTNYWHLNNLIWVLGYSHNGENIANWNPGERYYDIVGADTYDNTELNKLYTGVKAIAKTDKPMALHECGTNPTEVQFEKYPWCYFMTWHTNYITTENNEHSLNLLYNCDRIITLDELNY